MFDLPPRVEERDGEPVVVDQQGYELVLRIGGRPRSDRTYHKPDPVAAARGRQRILCRYGRVAMKAGDSPLLWRRREALEGVWTCCEHCESDDPDEMGQNPNNEGPQLANQLQTDDVRAKVEAALQDAGSDAAGGDA